ncbi:Hypothetical protein PFR_JS7-2_1905 [Propionibacterium freudenreichii]|nr:Hypothetical protein PFR_JS7-1_1963 [Propionibacterium freudenreichii]SCQ54425.1 Hypothetical protein PFR_JS7-2_1905 [Propionibacterium freudenreichii]
MRGEHRTPARQIVGARITPAYAGRTDCRKRDRPGDPDHPRVCGENRLPAKVSLSPSGSPPRMRGELRVCRDSYVDPGITPAYAGRTQARRRCPSPPQDHPRVCGENSGQRSPLRFLGGSPPRMRGELSRPLRHPTRAGITPAYAGRTMDPCARIQAWSDHPRVCGENLNAPRGPRSRSGSPPRMRGEPLDLGVHIVEGRITPAYAGRTADAGITNVSTQGSPPRMRGEQIGGDLGARGDRITPAYAGRTKKSATGWRPFRDHPRVCGENCSAFDLVRLHRGSPPRMRGERGLRLTLLVGPRITPAYAGRTHRAASTPAATQGSPPRMRGELVRLDQTGMFNRITPAYAGRTSSRHRRFRGQGDHPRVCGENPPVGIQKLGRTGSPPRMRGELPPAPAGVAVAGITPAYAGRTVSCRPMWLHVRDHPRVCGENLSFSSDCCCSVGSPPRMRGEHFLTTHVTGAQGRYEDVPSQRPHRRRLAALLHPERMPLDARSGVLGRRISLRPSRSTTSQSCLCTLKSKPCSFRAVCTRIARPSWQRSSTRAQMASRTRAETLPTKTPGLISSSHRVTNPRKPAGQAVSTNTIMAVHSMTGHPARPRPCHPKARQCPTHGRSRHR